MVIETMHASDPHSACHVGCMHRDSTQGGRLICRVIYAGLMIVLCVECRVSLWPAGSNQTQLSVENHTTAGLPLNLANGDIMLPILTNPAKENQGDLCRDIWCPIYVEGLSTMLAIQPSNRAGA